MIYFKDAESQKQFKLWMDKAEDARIAQRSCINAQNGHLLWGNKQAAMACRDELPALEWANKFMGQVFRWMGTPVDKPQLVLLYADKNTMVDGLAQEFSVVVYDREPNEFGYFPTVEEIQEAVVGRSRPFIYNGGWINHGDNQCPNWSMHT